MANGKSSWATFLHLPQCICWEDGIFKLICFSCVVRPTSFGSSFANACSLEVWTHTHTQSSQCQYGDNPEPHCQPVNTCQGNLALCFITFRKFESSNKNMFLAWTASMIGTYWNNPTFWFSSKNDQEKSLGFKWSNRTFYKFSWSEKKVSQKTAAVSIFLHGEKLVWQSGFRLQSCIAKRSQWPAVRLAAAETQHLKRKKVGFFWLLYGARIRLI